MQADILDALRRGANDEALSLARKDVADDHHNPDAYRLLAMTLRASGDNVAALASVDRAIALAPDDADLHFHRAGYLLGERRVDAAQVALSQSVQLDPNQFGAYVMQAQLALARGDVGEAERIARLASRVDAEHPWTLMIEGRIALQRGDADRALARLARAAELAPDDAQIRYALGFAYLHKGHHAFAEQALLGVVDKIPDARGLLSLIAELQRRQDRFDDAITTLAPLLADADPSPALLRFGGELELFAGRPGHALPLLRRALAARPDDARTLTAMFRIWHATDARDDARNTLDAALATSPQLIDLWRARVAVEPAGSDAALEVIARWRRALPDAVAPLEIEIATREARGDRDGIETAAQRILSLQPGHLPASMRIVEAVMQRDAEAAVAHVDGLIAATTDAAASRAYRGWRALACDRAGRHRDAVDGWQALHADLHAQTLPPPEPTALPATWPDLAQAVAIMAPVAFLAGAPGSGVERIASVLAATVPRLLVDRFGSAPPDDALQRIDTATQLANGTLSSAEVAASWSAQLAARGLHNGAVIDWLLWWDNAWVALLREQFPQAQVLLALRDPRDMLLHWLAFGAPLNLQLASPTAAARWLAAHLEHVAALDEQSLFAHTLLRIDATLDDPAALSDAVAAALGTPLPPPPDGRLDAPHFAAGHWRDYADVLADAFALLAPVARRLGYPDV
ncbi:MAG: tetratricopeptide repeat protein [Luteimonas sp.]